MQRDVILALSVPLFVCPSVNPDVFLFFLSAGPNAMKLYTSISYDNLQNTLFSVHKIFMTEYLVTEKWDFM